MSIDARFRIDRGDFVLDVDLSLPGRGVTALFGPSGSGKTTLLRAIAGLEPCCGGSLQVNGEVWQTAAHCLPPHRRDIAYVFQEASLFSHLDVRGNLDYGRKRVPAAQRNLSLDNIIDLLDIGDLLSRRVDALSGGEQQRVAIARALAVCPKLLLMDEPLAALDIARKQDIMPYLETLHDELQIPVLYVSHSPDEVARLADHLVLLEHGAVLSSGPIAEQLSCLELPPARRGDAEALIEAVVAGHDEPYALTFLAFPGGRFTVPYKPLEIGSRVRVGVAARDVSLTLEQQTGTSILNIFPAEIDEIADAGPSQVMVRLLAGGVPVLSRITRKSAAMLSLQPGKRVYAQAKTVALLS